MEDLKRVGAEARDCLQWILEGMGIDAGIELSLRDEQVRLNILCGDDSSVVIGRKGQTLEALQVIVNRIVLRMFDDPAPARIVVDVEGYRERRRNNLLDMARRSADSVRETGESVLLSPLNSYERFLVHTALKEEEGIVSKSQGEGAMKQIRIAPESRSDS
jgi:spoIIIJ-associated protein